MCFDLMYLFADFVLKEVIQLHFDIDQELIVPISDFSQMPYFIDPEQIVSSLCLLLFILYTIRIDQLQ